jgi:hypothetical protein
MPAPDLLARALPWMCLLAIALVLVVRVARGSLSRLGVAVSAVAVVACLVAGLHGDSAEAGSDMTAARHELLLGCLDRGELRSVCECAGDEVLRRLDHSAERFAALEREMVRRQNAGQGPPALVLDAARACG